MQRPSLTCRWWSPWKWKSSSGPNFALPVDNFISKVIFRSQQQADEFGQLIQKQQIWLLTYLELPQTVFGVSKELWGEPNHLLLRHLLVLLDDDRQPLTIYHMYIWWKLYLHVLLDHDQQPLHVCYDILDGHITCREGVRQAGDKALRGFCSSERESKEVRRLKVPWW